MQKHPQPQGISDYILQGGKTKNRRRVFELPYYFQDICCLKIKENGYFQRTNHSIDFGKELTDDVACKRYLSKLKWEKGFKCSKCGHSSGFEKSGFNYHCYKCNHVESSTTGTISPL